MQKLKTRNISKPSHGIPRLATLLLIGVGGCTSMPADLISEQPAEGQVYSPAAQRELIVDKSRLISGDYFLERGQQPEARVVGKDTELRERTERDTQALQQEIQVLEQRVEAVERQKGPAMPTTGEAQADKAPPASAVPVQQTYEAISMRLQVLEKLRADGAITQEEYQKKRAEILGDL